MRHYVIPMPLQNDTLDHSDRIHPTCTIQNANHQVASALHMEHLTDAQILLLAAQLAATPDLTKFRLLAAHRQDILSPFIIYRILLTYLPLDSTAAVKDEIRLLLTDVNSGFNSFSSLDASENNIILEPPSPRNAERSLSGLRLEKVPIHFEYERDDSQTQHALSDFLIAWVHKVEAFSGIDSSIANLVDHFAAQQPLLNAWNDTYLKPLYRLEHDFYPSQSDPLSLRDLENAHDEGGVSVLLQCAQHSGRPENIKRDIEEVVTPWIIGSRRTKRRRLNTPSEEALLRPQASWSDVNTWLFSVAQTKYALAAASVEQWNGPAAMQDVHDEASYSQDHEDPNIAYIRTVIALVYTSAETDDSEVIDIKRNLLKRVAQLAQLMPPDFEQLLPDIPDPGIVRQSTRADLLRTALLSKDNLLTKPSSDTIDFLYGVLSTQSLLNRLKLESTTHSVTSTVLFESEEKQKGELRTILSQMPRLTRSAVEWTAVREQLRWLHGWSEVTNPSQPQNSLGYLGRLSLDFIELEALDAMLAAGEFQSVKDIYILNQPTPISADLVKQHVKAAMLNAYDNASNGNRTRGGVKKASDILSSFRPSFPDAIDFEHIEYLIKATHSLSFYQLTLQHGVPFQPVSIRVSKDPLSLLGKVLEQNSKAFTKLDDLVDIARNLVRADLPMPQPPDYPPDEVVPLERRLQDAEHRVTYLAITAALADNDFDTAYSLITTRLTASSKHSGRSSTDDTSWRAAYAAGKYRPPNSPSDIHKRIAALSQRMDLLSTALTFAPTAEVLPEILATWRRCEEEMDSLKAQAVQEERALDVESASLLPGGFGPSDRDLDANETRRLLENRRTYNATGPSYEEEAPMGLFDVARGAANALRKNAFPLRGAAGPGQQGFQVDPPRGSTEDSTRSSGESERPGSADGQQRVRKRDMLSNAVTGTLVGGMSWMLGAQPVNRPQQGQ